MTPFILYLQDGTLPENRDEARKIRVNAGKYTIMTEVLYRKGYSMPWLRCVTAGEGKKVIEDVHSGSCGSHVGSRAVTQKVLRTGYLSADDDERHARNN